MKRLCKFSIIMLLMIVLSSIFVTETFAGEMADYAHKTYDEVMQESASSLVGRKFTDYLSSGDDNFRQFCDRFLCIEKEAVTKWQNFYIYAVIDVDGGNPTVAQYTTASGTKPIDDVDDIACLAYVAARAERTDKHDNEHNSSYAFGYFLNEVRPQIDYGLPYHDKVTKYTKDLDYVKKAKEYRDEVLNGTAETVYSARILVFQGGSMQTTAILYGKEGSGGTITVNKYITNGGTDRSTWEEDEKSKKPAEFAPNGAIVDYNIVIENTFAQDVEVLVNDVFENNKTNGGLEIYDYSGWTRNGANSYSRSVIVPAGSSETVTLSLMTYSKILVDGASAEDVKAYTEVYRNTVTITSEAAIAKDKSSDYVKVGAEDITEVTTEPSGNIQKYISAVNGNSVGGRENRSSDDKFKDPVIVQKGDVVTYTLKVENTSELDMYSCKIKDTPENGLTLLDKGDIEDFSMGPGETYIGNVTIRVDKSNMYLFNLENDIDFVGGKYTKEIEYTYVDIIGVMHTFTISIPDTPIPASVRNDINSGNMDKDYVRLKELIIAGDVWIDSNKDGYMKSETKLDNIAVILHNVTDGTTMNTVTDSNGHYEFSGFYKGTNFVQEAGCSGYYDRFAVHKEYYVEFVYNGVKYIATVYSGRNNLSSDNSYNSNYLIDSNATEFKADREKFNESFETIGYNKAIGTSGVKELSFTKNGHVSTLADNDSTKISAYSFVKEPGRSSYDKLFLSHDGETDYLEYINLGLIEREKLDLRITKDLLESEVRINGYSMDYEFGQLDQNTLYQNANPYELYVYRADYAYRYDMYKNQEVRDAKGEASELQVDLSYKITVFNESLNTTFPKVNEIIDLYTAEMTIKPGTSVYMIKNGTRKDLTVSDTSSYNGEQDYSFMGYRCKFITGMDDEILKNGEKIEIFLTYTLDKDINRSIYLGNKINVAQISAYSTYTNSSADTLLGLVDIDSNAGNVNKDCVNVEDVDKFEDNVFRSRTVVKIKTDEREVTGFVFEDTRSQKVLPFNHFTGNGLYDIHDERNGELVDLFANGMKRDPNQDLDADKKLDGMTVELVEIVTVGDKVFEEMIDPTGLGNVVVRTQTAGGVYRLSSFIPSTYIVRFRYGDIFKDGTMSENALWHNGQDYKSTAYTLVDGSGAVLESKADNDVKYAALTAANASDARDNELRRIEVMAESEIMTHKVAEFMKYTNYDTNSISEELKDFVRATNIFADTVTVSLGIENKADTVNKQGERVAFRNFDEIALLMPNVDYGMVFRPENFIEMTKKIKKMRLETSTGEVLVEIEYDDDGNIISEIGAHQVQSVDTIGYAQGFRYINVDEEILQGASIVVEYTMYTNNIGEVDTVSRFLHDEGGSEAILAKLNSKRSVIQSNGGASENYIRMTDLISAVYAGKIYNYGLFVGDIYYRGEKGDATDVVAVPITVNKILDFIDNDATFIQTNNNTQGKHWNLANENELRENGYVGAYGLFVNAAGDRYYKDEQNRKYNTDERHNLVVNVSSVLENPTLIVPIYPEYLGTLDSESFIVIQMDAILGADNDSKDMVYENVAEIIEFTTPVGRRTNFASTIGNIEINGTLKPFTASQKEVDSDGTEVIRLTPPTGMTKLTLYIAGNTYTILVVTGLVVLSVIGYLGKLSLYGKVGKTRFYK